MQDTLEKNEALITGPQCAFAESGQHHLLCVDDEQSLSLLTAEILTIHGFRVTVLSNPLRAAEVMNREDIELAVLDYEVPEMSGTCLAAQLKSAQSNVKVALFTGTPQVPASELSSVDAVVNKSDGVQVLVATVNNLVATR